MDLPYISGVWNQWLQNQQLKVGAAAGAALVLSCLSPEQVREEREKMGDRKLGDAIALIQKTEAELIKELDGQAEGYEVLEKTDRANTVACMVGSNEFDAHELARAAAYRAIEEQQDRIKIAASCEFGKK